MDLTWPVLLFFAIFSVSLLTAGVVLGKICHSQHAGHFSINAEQERRVTQIAERLQELVTSVSTDVGEYKTRMEEAQTDLKTEAKQPSSTATDFVLNVIGRILENNETLQKRLCAAEDKLEEQHSQLKTYLIEAYTDPLTRLPNRRAFEEQLVERLQKWHEKNASFDLAILDLDYFKALNDTRGHLAGDYILRQFAAILRHSIHGDDLIARIGGEEFAILYTSPAWEDSGAWVDQLRRRLAEKEFEFEGQPIHVTMSAGLARIREGERINELIARADQALYSAKNAGRNCLYLQNGHDCLAYSVEPETHGDEEGLAGLCTELRSKMKEVLQQDGEDSGRLDSRTFR